MLFIAFNMPCPGKIFLADPFVGATSIRIGAALPRVGTKHTWIVHPWDALRLAGVGSIFRGGVAVAAFGLARPDAVFADTLVRAQAVGIMAPLPFDRTCHAGVILTDCADLQAVATLLLIGIVAMMLLMAFGPNVNHGRAARCSEQPNEHSHVGRKKERCSRVVFLVEHNVSIHLCTLVASRCVLLKSCWFCFSKEAVIGILRKIRAKPRPADATMASACAATWRGRPSPRSAWSGSTMAAADYTPP